jgi:DNA polymerase/3'-5' exonuclease PolX
MEVAEIFKHLSSLHQSSPLLPVDSWKSYMFRIVSGRIANLNFEISDDPDTLERLREVKGIGSSSFDKIKEYLSTGTFSRIKEFETDPRRIAMKNMMDIWGVGRVKVC